MPARSWLDLTTEEVSARGRGGEFARSVAVLPVAAVEQHGPHLPLGTDAIIAQGYLQVAAALVPDDLDVLTLPVQTIGKSDEHDAFPGTLTLTAETALRSWTEIGASVKRAGCERLVIVSSHGGNSPVTDLVASELRSLGMIAATTSWSRLGYPNGLFPPDEIRHGIHAGGIETALMLALRPDLVRMDRIDGFTPRSLAMEREYSVLRAGRPAGFAWKAGDLHPSGAIGDARLGTAQAGRALLEHGAKVFVALLADVSRFQL